MEYQTCIYTQDRHTKSITLYVVELYVVELGGSAKSSIEEAFNTFKCLNLDPKEIFKIETRELT